MSQRTIFPELEFRFIFLLLFQLRWVLVAARGILVESCRSFTEARGLSSSGTRPQWLRVTRDLSSPTRDRTHILCLARWILSPWTTRTGPSGFSHTGTGGVKSWFWPDSGGDALLSSFPQPFTGALGQEVSCELSRSLLA